ncbi:4-methyl-5(B-hydroxyethyl)-thiazole monophosphate biosynthesis protein [candidate division KSB1 bacterium]|nr:MAG: 4-methyl-5(B-hydroxyethyl)-thiazole monophosphate biosynthesis protein [candidate division KSB1 bacterium]
MFLVRLIFPKAVHNDVMEMPFMNKEKTDDLSDYELEFYSRQIALPEIGYNGQLKLKKAKVCIAGLGGLGSPAALQLAAMGVGHLRLVDRDVVELSNLQRQLLYNVNFLGYPKVEVAAKRLSELNPNIEIEPMPLSVNVETAYDIVKDVDVVIDGLDRMTPRYALNRACQKAGTPYVFAAALMTFGNVSTIIPGETPCLECFQGNLDDETLPTCAVVGVHPSILSIIASIEASEAVRIILGNKPHLAGKILHCDLGNMEFEEIEISKADNCPVCGSKPMGQPMPLKQKLIAEICGREGRRVFVITPRKDLKLEMGKLYSNLKEMGFKIKVKADLGLTFETNSKRSASILKSGIMVIEGAEDEEEAYSLYNKIILEGLGVPKSRIEWER